MSKIAGVSVLLKVDKSALQDGSDMVVIGGQKGASLSRSAETIDVSDKTTGGWATSMMGLKSWSLDCDGFVTLGDEALTQLHDSFDKRTPLNVEIEIGNYNNGAGGTQGAYKYSGKVVIVDFPEDYAMDNAVSYSLSLQGASPLVREVHP